MARRFRLISGLILFAYVLTHFVNHNLGIISIAAIEAMLAVVSPIWSFPPATFLFYKALVTHMTLALYTLWQRRSLKLTVHETVQYVLGFSVPLLLAEHVTNARATQSMLRSNEWSWLEAGPIQIARSRG